MKFLLTLVLPLAVIMQAPATERAPATTSQTQEQRPLSAFPDGLRPFVKYGVGGGVVLWFVGSLYWIARQRLRQANTPEKQLDARQWLRRLVASILLAVLVLGAAVVMSLRTRELLYIWIAAPVALLLPILLVTRPKRQ